MTPDPRRHADLLANDLCQTSEQFTICCGCGACVPYRVDDGIVTFLPCPTCAGTEGEYRLVETGPPGATYSAPRWYPSASRVTNVLREHSYHAPTCGCPLCKAMAAHDEGVGS